MMNETDSQMRGNIFTSNNSDFKGTNSFWDKFLAVPVESSLFLKTPDLRVITPVKTSSDKTTTPHAKQGLGQSSVPKIATRNNLSQKEEKEEVENFKNSKLFRLSKRIVIKTNSDESEISSTQNCTQDSMHDNTPVNTTQSTEKTHSGDCDDNAGDDDTSDMDDNGFEEIEKKPTLGEYHRQLVRREKLRLKALKREQQSKSSFSSKRKRSADDKTTNDLEDKSEGIYISAIISKARFRVVCGLFALEKTLLIDLLEPLLENKEQRKTVRDIAEKCVERGFGEVYGDYEPIPSYLYRENAKPETNSGSYNHKEITVGEFLDFVQRDYNQQQSNKICASTKLLFEYFNIYKNTYFNINYETLLAHIECLLTNGVDFELQDNEKKKIGQFEVYLRETQKNGHIPIQDVLHYFATNTMPDIFLPIQKLLDSFEKKKKYYTAFSSNKIFSLFNSSTISNTLQSIHLHKTPHSAVVEFKNLPHKTSCGAPHKYRFFNNFEVHVAAGNVESYEDVGKIYYQLRDLLKQYFPTDNIFIVDDEGNEAIDITTITANAKFDLGGKRVPLERLLIKIENKIPGVVNASYEPQLTSAMILRSPTLFGKTSAGNNVTMKLHNSGKFTFNGLTKDIDLQELFEKVKTAFVKLIEECNQELEFEEKQKINSSDRHKQHHQWNQQHEHQQKKRRMAESNQNNDVAEDLLSTKSSECLDEPCSGSLNNSDNNGQESMSRSFQNSNTQSDPCRFASFGKKPLLASMVPPPRPNFTSEDYEMFDNNQNSISCSSTTSSNVLSMSSTPPSSPVKSVTSISSSSKTSKLTSDTLLEGLEFF